MPDKYAETRKRWMSAKLDRLDLSMPKGKKEKIKNHASLTGESMNAFINRAIDETMDRDLRDSGVNDFIEFEDDCLDV